MMPNLLNQYLLVIFLIGVPVFLAAIVSHFARDRL